MFSPASSSSTCITALWKSGLNSWPTASMGFTPISSKASSAACRSFPFPERTDLRFPEHRCQASLEIVHDGKHLLHDLFGSDHIHAGFFLFRPFSEIVELSHLTFQLVGQLFNLLILFVFFLFLLAEEALFLFLLPGFRNFLLLLSLPGRGFLPCCALRLLAFPGASAFPFSFSVSSAAAPAYSSRLGSLLRSVFILFCHLSPSTFPYSNSHGQYGILLAIPL